MYNGLTWSFLPTYLPTHCWHSQHWPQNGQMITTEMTKNLSRIGIPLQTRTISRACCSASRLRSNWALSLHHTQTHTYTHTKHLLQARNSDMLNERIGCILSGGDVVVGVQHIQQRVNNATQFCHQTTSLRTTSKHKHISAVLHNMTPALMTKSSLTCTPRNYHRKSNPISRIQVSIGSRDICQDSSYLPSRGGLGRLAAWQLPGGPVGPPAWWAATSNVEGESGESETEKGTQETLAREGWLYLENSFAIPRYATDHGASVPNYPGPVWRASLSLLPRYRSSPPSFGQHANYTAWWEKIMQRRTFRAVAARQTMAEIGRRAKQRVQHTTIYQLALQVSRTDVVRRRSAV